eukprot:SAG25_NODE_271_length_10616_cov_28.967091_9_plen_103_part_00
MYCDWVAGDVGRVIRSLGVGDVNKSRELITHPHKQLYSRTSRTRVYSYTAVGSCQKGGGDVSCVRLFVTLVWFGIQLYRSTIVAVDTNTAACRWPMASTAPQ